MFDNFEVSGGGVLLPRVKPIKMGLWMPGEAMEEFFNFLPDEVVKFFKRILVASDEHERLKILQMAGSVANYASKNVGDLLFGKTAYTGETTLYPRLWSSALDSTFTGATSGETAYGSYAAMSLTNNTTIFAAGSGTTTYTKTWPSDATKSWATSTATGTNNTITYLGVTNGNAGTSADKAVAWCSVTSTTINSGDTPQLAQNVMSVVIGG